MKAPPDAERRPGQGGVPSIGGDLGSVTTVQGVMRGGTYEPDTAQAARDLTLCRALAWGDDDRTDAAAVHEAGHAVARLAASLPFRYVTIRRRGGQPGEGYLAVRPRRFANFGEQFAAAVATAAGPEAERRHYVEHRGSDTEEADWLLEIMGGGCGDDAALAQHDDSMRQHLRGAAAALVSDHWPAVMALAHRLLTDPRTLAYPETRQIVRALPCWPEYLR